MAKAGRPPGYNTPQRRSRRKAEVSHLLEVELQGARITKLLIKLGTPNQRLVEYLNIPKDKLSRMLNDHMDWSPELVEKTVRFFNERGIDITYDELFVPINRKKHLKIGPMVTIHDLLRSQELLSIWADVPLDVATRDWIGGVLLQIRDHLEANRVNLLRKHNRHVEKAEHLLASRAAVVKIAEDHQLFPFQLERIFEAHGNYKQYQEEFDHYYNWYMQPEQMQELKRIGALGIQVRRGRKHKPDHQ